MRLNLILFTAFFALISFYACDPDGSSLTPSSNIDQDFIYTEYEWRYDANEHVTAAYAFFYELDTSDNSKRRIALSGTSKVFCNGQELYPSGSVDGRYEFTFQGRIDTGYFDWVDANGWWYYNDAILDPIYHPNEIPILPVDNHFNYVWNGLDIWNDQEVSLNVRMVGGDNNGDNFDVSTSELTADHIRVPKKRLKKLGVGTVIVRIQREWEPALAQSTFWGGGELRAIYIAEDGYTKIQ